MIMRHNTCGSPIYRLGGAVLCLALGLLALTGLQQAPPAIPTPPKRPAHVCILQVIEHPALRRTTQGIIDGLLESDPTVKIDIQNAQGNPTLAAQIAERFIAHKPDVVVGVGTLAAQSFVRYARTGVVPLVFSSVTDPAAAGLLGPGDIPLPGIMGVSNHVPLGPQLALFREIQPQLLRLGFLYNPSEGNSVSILRALTPAATAMGIHVIPQMIARSADIPAATARLLRACDAIFISNDNTALSAMPIITHLGTQAQIPVYVSDIDGLDSGALAAFGADQYALGRQTAALVVSLLKGETPESPIQGPTALSLVLNRGAARALLLTLPPELCARAHQIIDP